MMTKNEIIKTAARLGLDVQIWGGDGQTRYEFSGPRVTSQLCMGKREASVYLAGFESGRVSK